MSTGPLSRTALSRVTLVGARGRAELVLPSREPLGVLLPEVLRLLEDGSPHISHHRLIAADGSALEADSTLESAGVADGAVLRLAPVEDSVSAPATHAEPAAHAGIDLDTWCWRPAARRVMAGASTVVWAVLAGLLARDGHADALTAAGGTSVAAAALAALAGALLGRAGHKGLATTLLTTAGAVGVLGVWTLADAHDWPGAARLACAGGVLAGALLLLGLFSPVGRSGVVGAAAVAGCGVCWEAALALQSGGGTAQESARAGALVAVASVVALGLLPRLSLKASGLSGLDDRRSGGASVSRYEVSTALAATHRELALASGALAVSAAVATICALRAPTVWTVLLAVAVALVLALRARAFPLTGEVVALLAAGAVVAVRLAWVWLDDGSGAAGPPAALAVLALMSLGVLAVRPAERVRVRLRRVGDVLESVGVIALLPLVIGVFGVYGRLLGTFA
ncbi:type VII secretion integral membrane protein EccD [Streptomyces sp. NPDC056240]|uniref:type VII secretion integral membrane protein EccD n=1 Tax=Streptomyces sp. NPDC056240 TaxID=3345759 RepID=UPI0035D7417F